MLRATTVCTFLTSKLPKVVREWFAFYILTSKLCFAPQQRTLFYFSTLRSLKSLEKHDFLTFSRTCIFFLLTLLFSDLLSAALLFSSFLFFDSYHLCFSSVHIVGSLTSKLPSMNYMHKMQRILLTRRSSSLASLICARDSFGGAWM